MWEFGEYPASDIVVIGLGTNDNNTHNNDRSVRYLRRYIEFVGVVHKVYPRAQIVLVPL